MKKFLVDIAPYGKVKTLNFNADVFHCGDVKRVRSDNIYPVNLRIFLWIIKLNMSFRLPILLTKMALQNVAGGPYLIWGEVC